MDNDQSVNSKEIDVDEQSEREEAGESTKPNVDDMISKIIDEEDETVESAEENDICLPLPSAEEPLLHNDIIA